MKVALLAALGRLRWESRATTPWSDLMRRPSLEDGSRGRRVALATLIGSGSRAAKTSGFHAKPLI